MANSKQIVEIIVRGLFFEGCFQNFDGIMKVIFGKLIVDFINCGLDYAAGFFGFWTLG